MKNHPAWAVGLEGGGEVCLTPLGDFKEEVALNRISKGRGEGRACVESCGWLLEAGLVGGVGGMAGGGASEEGRAFDEIGEN